MNEGPGSNVPNVCDGPGQSFTDWLRARSEPAWSTAVGHTFVRELKAGTLSEAVFAEYLVQDYAFLDALVGAFGFAVGQAPTMTAKRPLIAFLDTLTHEENDYFERSFDALSVPESRRKDPALTRTTAALVDLFGRAAREGGYEETLAVVVPAEWIYERWATAGVGTDAGSKTASAQSVGGVDRPSYYSEWVDLHANPSFVEFVDWLCGQLDEHGPDLSERRRDRVDGLFRRTVELEVEFFESAYESAGEPSGSNEPAGRR